VELVYTGVVKEQLILDILKCTVKKEIVEIHKAFIIRKLCRDLLVPGGQDFLQGI
jgi:hypothetical protein